MHEGSPQNVNAYRGQHVDLKNKAVQGCLILCIASLEVRHLSTQLGILGLQTGNLSLEASILDSDFRLAGRQNTRKSTKRLVCDALNQSRSFLRLACHMLSVVRLVQIE